MNYLWLFASPHTCVTLDHILQLCDALYKEQGQNGSDSNRVISFLI